MLTGSKLGIFFFVFVSRPKKQPAVTVLPFILNVPESELRSCLDSQSIFPKATSPL